MRDGSATRKKLERCALNLFVEKGITATTIKDIANEAQIAEGTLYRHFKSKDELAQSLFVTSYEATIQSLNAIVSDSKNIAVQIKEMVEFFAQKFDEDPVLFRYLLLSQHNQVQYLSNDQNNAHYLLTEVVSEAMKNQLLPKEDPHIHAAIIMGIVLQSALSRVYQRIQRKMVDDAPILTKAILRAIQAEA